MSPDDLGLREMGCWPRWLAQQPRITHDGGIVCPQARRALEVVGRRLALLLHRQEITLGARWVRQHPQPRSDTWAAILRSAGIAFIFSGGSKDKIHTMNWICRAAS
jgi:hypothetical protein